MNGITHPIIYVGSLSVWGKMFFYSSYNRFLKMYLFFLVPFVKKGNVLCGVCVLWCVPMLRSAVLREAEMVHSDPQSQPRMHFTLQIGPAPHHHTDTDGERAAHARTHTLRANINTNYKPIVTPPAEGQRLIYWGFTWQQFFTGAGGQWRSSSDWDRGGGETKHKNHLWDWDGRRVRRAGDRRRDGEQQRTPTVSPSPRWK